MKKLLYTALAVVLLLSVQAVASQVDNVELTYKDGFTVAVIHVDGAVRFTHQTEEAKDGKPFRVIVDVLSATHQLGAKNFMNLPDCPVQSIRTSQYSVSPEKVVRLVFDMDSERVYRIDSDKNSVSLFFSDNSTKSFATWSSAPSMKKDAAKQVSPPASKPKVAVAAVTPEPKKSATDLNKSIDNDRMLSLSENNSPSTKVKKNPVEQSSSATGMKTEVYGPDVNLAKLNKEIEEQQKAEAEKKAQALAKAELEKKAQAQSLAKAEAEKKAAVTTPPAKKEVVVAQTPPVKDPAPAKIKSSEPAKKSADKKVAQANTATKAEDKKATSRFRRNPVSNKIKGTMVAQFPKRLVIKYKTKAMRDPFATLIDESKTYNNPVEKRIPNVEGLKLVGIIQAENKSENRALFEDSDNYGYILKTGDKVRKGYVLRVDEDRVYFQIFEYGWSRTIALNLES